MLLQDCNSTDVHIKYSPQRRVLRNTSSNSSTLQNSTVTRTVQYSTVLYQYSIAVPAAVAYSTRQYRKKHLQTTETVHYSKQQCSTALYSITCCCAFQVQRQNSAPQQDEYYFYFLLDRLPERRGVNVDNIFCTDAAPPMPSYRVRYDAVAMIVLGTGRSNAECNIPRDKEQNLPLWRTAGLETAVRPTIHTVSRGSVVALVVVADVIAVLSRPGELLYYSGSIFLCKNRLADTWYLVASSSVCTFITSCHKDESFGRALAPSTVLNL